MTLADANGNPRKPARFSQRAKVLHLLQDGQWHTTAQILREVPCIVHSRIAELRKHGYVIEHRTSGSGAEGHSYKLLSPARADSPSSRPASRGGSTADPAPAPPQQLSFA